MTKFIRVSLILAAVFFSFSALAQNKNYQSRFWRISKEGRPDSYLYGTMHVSDKIAFNLSDSFYIALKSVKTVGLESNPARWLDSFNTFENSQSYEGSPRFATYASKGYYQNSVVFRKLENDDIASWLKTKSGILNAMLYRENSYNKEYQEDTWLEMHIYQTATKNEIPVVSLEGFTESRQLVMRASFEEANDKNKTIVPKWLEEILEDKSRYSIIEDAYRTGDLDMIDTINRVFNSAGYYKYMLTERNKNMVRRFKEYEAEGPVFMAVGAAHLPGYDGVIDMLRAQGYRVEPIRDQRTDFAKKQKEYHDSLVADISIANHIAPNQTFSMDWPGKLYGDRFGYTNSTLGYDLGNGMYFINQQLNTYGPLYGLTEEQMLAKADSLFFENIPGDIKSKKRITTNGFPGYEIKNVTRTGDHEQYRVYATPFQLSLFKISGRKGRVDVMGDSLFKTLKLTPLSKDWVTHDFVSGQFKVDVPTYHVMNIIDPIQTMYGTPYMQAYDPSDKSYYLVKRLSLHDVTYLEEDDFELKRFAEKFIEEMKYETVEILECDYNGMPCADFTAKTKYDTYVHGRCVLQGPFYYVMMAVNGKKKFGPSKFFNSLAFTETKYRLKSEQFLDTVLKASVYANRLLNERYLLERDYSSTAETSDYKSISDSKRYYSECDELVQVKREILGKYEYYEHPDSLWADRVEDYEDKTPYFVLDTHSFVHNGYLMMDVLLSDTGSVKQIHHRFVLSKNRDVLFTLSTLIDSINGASAFVRDFYDKFAPQDTVIRPSVFSNKARLVVEDYLNPDESTHKDVLNYINGYTFYKRAKLQKTDLALMQRALFENPYAEKEPFIKTVFIGMLGDIETDSAANLLKQIYDDHQDDYPVQIEAIEALARMKSDRASTVLEDILKNDEPFISPQHSFLFFNILTDTNRLKSRLYVTMLESMPDVYKDNIYGVLGFATGDTAIKVKPEYSDLLPDITKRYRYELKKSKVNEQIQELEKNKKESTGSSGSNYYYGEMDWSSVSTFHSSGGASGSLVNYYTLLLPYDTSATIQELLGMADDLKDFYNIKQIQEVRRMAQRKLNDDQLRALFKDEEKMLKAYDFLIEINRLDLLPDSLKDRDIFAKRCLDKASGSYDLKKDTIELLKTEMVDAKKGPMELYYFKVNKYKDPKKTSRFRMNDPSYRLVCVGFLKNEKGYYPTDTDFDDYTSVDSDEKLQDAFDELKEAAEISDRKRAKPSKGNGSGGYYYGY
ncbi:MAG: TraB/GumN family protein [Bacteroidetes bacterium]|nr:TraB/GumN family protein [Bacteroidota bacterium]